MPSPAEDRSRVVAVINALKVDGIRVKNWKNYLNGGSPNNDNLRKESQYKFAFGRDLSLLPKCHVEDTGGTVSKFLVDACEFLSHHLHTEGLFRKTGSLIRIRSLRAGLEQGHLVFSQPYSPSLLPCDVASLLKQFLRELPSPLIPVDLQGPLCLAQCLEAEEEGLEGRRDEATLLLTALFPPIHSRALRYFCTFLRQAADRCDENRMEAGNLALVIAPNLLQCPAGGSKLTASTERQLNIQAAVIKALIKKADRIGAIPSSLLCMSPVAEGRESVLPVDGGRPQERTRLGVYRSLRRQRRRSVGEIFVDALSKLKTGLAPSGPSNPTDSHQNPRSPTPQSPAGTTKRKSTEDPVTEAQGSAKKRRSIQDLRDNQLVKQCSDDEASVSQSRSSSSVLSGVEGSREQEACVTLNVAEKKRNQKIYNRLTAEEDKAHRRRTLRLFNMSTEGTLMGNAPENWRTETGNGSTGAAAERSVSEGDGSPRIPAILVEGPGRGIVENEVEDDPDLLNYSFAETPTDPPDPPASPCGIRRAKLQREPPCAVLEDEAVDGSDGWNDISRDLGDQAEAEAHLPAQEAGPDKRPAEAEGSGWVSMKPRRPRRSLSMPEVTLIHSGRPDDPRGEDAGDRSLLSMQEDEAPEEVWPAWTDLEKRRLRGGTATPGDGGTGKERRDGAEPKKQEKKEKQAAFKRGMSMAERLRRFNTLAMLLRTPRAPVPPPGPQLPDVLQQTLLVGAHCGVGRLRRQGARRFGRSISHDGVPGALEPESVGQQQSQEEEEEPEEGHAHGQPVQSVAPAEATTSPGTSRDTPVPESHPAQGVPSRRENVPQTAPQRNQGPAEDIATETDLHELLLLRLNLRDSEQAEGKDVAAPQRSDRQTQTDVPRRIKALVRQDAQVTEAPPPPPAPLAMHLYTESCSLTLSIATQTDRATPQDGFHSTRPETVRSPDDISELDFVAVDMDMPFRSRATKRRYRDSPRWHVHEISVTTGDPVHI